MLYGYEPTRTTALLTDYHQKLRLKQSVAGQQAQEAVSGAKPEKMQARGRALLNLKLRDSEGGLLGRTLLTLILNKVHLLYMHMLRPAVCLIVMPFERNQGPVLPGNAKQGLAGDNLFFLSLGCN